MNSQRLQLRCVWSLLVLVAGLLGACEAPNEGASSADASMDSPSADAGTCNVPAEGCPCGPETLPEPCYPDSAASDEDGGVAMCHEGTRYCRDGAYTACLNVQSYEAPPRATSALVDQTSTHPQCSDCRPNCYRVVDDLTAIDGPLDATNSSGVEYDATLGGAVKLSPSGGTTTPPPVTVSVPPGSILVPAPEGIPSSGTGAGSHHAPQADVYLMLDHASRMTVEIQSLYDGWSTGAYLPSGAQCVGGNAALASAGVAGALQCMIADSATGVGRFGDIPFDPYSTTLAVPDDYEVAYQNMSNLATNPATAESAIASVFAAKESTGDPDIAGSAVPALYAMSTSSGLNMGLGKSNVPDPTACGAPTDYGYPCYRTGSDRIVVMVTDAPMHNGPVNASYDYDPTNLSTVFGTAPAVAVPPTNDDFSSVYNMTPGPDASQILATYTGSSSTLTPVVPASEVNLVPACGADDLSPDAIFSFDVVDTGSPVPVTISTQGTSFQTTLSVHDGPIGGVSTLPASANTNNLFSSAQNLGDLAGGAYEISGSTAAGGISSGYQGIMFGQCGANTLAPDAVYRIANSGSQPLTVELDAGSNRGVLSVYDVAGGTYGQHQWLGNTEASSNLNTVGDFGDAHVISTGAGNEYLSVQGNTSAGTVAANYNQAAFTNATLGLSCTVDPSSKDVIFEYDVTGAPKTVQFDTEGSAFDTVLGLYDVLPISNGGPVTTTASNNLNTDVPTVEDIGSINGRDVTYTGNTGAMTGNITDNIGCGFDNTSACGDAVYKFTVTERTTLRMDVTSGSYDPGLMVTRAAPDGAQGRYTSFSTGLAHTCAVSGGQVYCWGSNASGQLGGTPSSAGAPVLVTDGSAPLLDVVQVTAGRDHSCAITVDGDAYCWGANGSGQLGQAGPASAVATPVTAINNTLPAAMQITAGDDFTCALLKDATVACWGSRTDGRTGTGTTSGVAPPTRISTTDKFVMVEAGHAHACAIRTGDRAVRCWGNGGSGRLGHNSTGSSATPVLVRTNTSGALLTRASYVSAGGQHSCATTTSGRGYCWGEGDYGRLGTGNSTDSSIAKPIQDVFGDIGGLHGGWAAGGTHTCITSDQGFVLCFGRDNVGQLGDDTTAANQSKPVPTYGIVDGLEVVSNYDHTCALKRAGTLECWGAGGSRRLGDFSTANALTPVVAHDGTSGGSNVTYGTGYIDTGFSQACRSTAQAPDSGCTRQVNPANGKAYFFCDNSVAQDWGQAGQTCRSVGMEFALPDEPGENAWIASNLPGGQAAWIGVARATDNNDWLTLTGERDFVDYNGNLVYDNTQEGGTYKCGFLNLLTCSQPNDGNFVGAYAAAGLTKSLWGDLLNIPSSAWGHNCVQVTGSGNWQTVDCTDMEDPASSGPSCGGLLGFLLCLVGAVLFVTGSLLGVASTWLGSSLQLLGQSLAGITYSSPLVNGGTAAPFVCEESAQPTDLTLDPGEYYVTVKGTVDPNTGVCDGDYTLQVQDLGSPTGGMLACDDNGVAETTSSRITHTFTKNGKHYLVLKGRNAGSAGAYNLTVRETDVINNSGELSCDIGTGAGDPATVTLAPGSDNYVMIKGDAPVDSGPYTLSITDPAAGSNTLACDSTGNSSMMLNLTTGTYYAVLKGKGPGESGDYQVQIGGATPTSGTYVPPTYADTVTALTTNNVRVATVVTCAATDPGCTDAQAQAAALATDTSGVVRVAANESDVPSEVVAAVRLLETASKVQALDIVYAPDANPGFASVTVQALADPSNQCAGLDGSDASMRTWLNCAPGASPGYTVSVLNPATAPVTPSATGPGGAYQFTLPLEITLHDGGVVTQNIPVYVVPSAAAASGTYSNGSYDQQFDARGCDAVANLRPTWNEFTYSADVRPDTELIFYGCTADSTADLSTCDTGSSSSGYQRFLTVTAGTGSGTSCTVLTESVDCGSDGFCNTTASGGVVDAGGNLIGVCNYLEGAACTVDADCPGAASGACRSTGPSFSTLGKTCRVLNQQGHPASALGADDGRPFMRMKSDLVSSGSGSRTPTLYNWEMIYNCQAVE